MKKVFIGVGHGGADAGAVANGLYEKNVNLAVAMATADELRRHGVDVEISRTTDKTEDLTVRIQKANAFKPDCAFDVHFNAGGGDGFECYYQTNKFESQSKKLGQLIEQEVKAIGQNSRGLKTKINGAGLDWFGFVRQVECPALLLEGAFLDSKDKAIIDTAAKQKAFGIAYAKATLRFLGIQYKQQSTTDKTTLYRVQTGAFKTEENAESLAYELDEKGFDTYVIYVDGWHKVQVGAFADPQNADAMKEKIENAGYHAFVTTNGGDPVTPAKKSVEEIAREVLDGKWGNGVQRFTRLTDAGYDYNAVQAIVNQLLK